MGALDVGKNALSSLTGHTEKAVITITDRRKIMDDITITEVKTARGSEAVLTSGEGIVSSSEGGDLNSKINNMMDEYVKGHGLNKTTKSYTVKFNPSTLTLSATGGGKFAKTNYTKSGSKVEYGSLNQQIQITCQLIFDDYEYGEAFMNPTANLSVQNAVKKGVKAVSNVTGLKKEYSVQPQIEAFTAALRNKLTREVTFSWGKLSYAGVINRFDATYTMFSTSGKPIRATANFGMICMYPEDVNGESAGPWQEWWQKAFPAGLNADGTPSISNQQSMLEQFINNNILNAKI